MRELKDRGVPDGDMAPRAWLSKRKAREKGRE
jgi:hypothetical protein